MAPQQGPRGRRQSLSDALAMSASTPPIRPVEWIPASQVLRHEERDFTVWLADNLELVGEALGLDQIILVERESRVESFRADILAVAVPVRPGVLVPTHTGRSSRHRTTGTPASQHGARTRSGQDQGLPSASAAPVCSERPSRWSAKIWPRGLRTFKDPPTLPPQHRQSNPTAAPPSSTSLSRYALTMLNPRGA